MLCELSLNVALSVYTAILKCIVYTVKYVFVYYYLCRSNFLHINKDSIKLYLCISTFEVFLKMNLALAECI